MHSKRKLIIEFFQRNKLLVVATFFANIISSLLNVLIPVSIGRFYQLALHDNSVKGKLFNALHISLQSVSDFFLFFILIIIAKSLITFVEKFLTGTIGERFSRDLRELLFKTQLSQSVAVNQIKPAGKYLLRYSGDLLFIQHFITKGVIQFTGDVMFMIASLAVLFAINAPLTLIMLAGIVVACTVIILLNKKVRVATLNRRNQRSTLLGFVANRMHAFFTIKSFNREVPEEIQYNKRSGKLYDFGISYWKIYSVVQALLPLFMFGTLTALLYFVNSQREIKPYGIHRTDVLDFVLLFLYMQAVIRRILKVNIVWNMGNVSFMKLLRILNFPAELKSEEREIKEIVGRVSFENVSFQYANAEAPILKDLSFTIEPNTITFIKGKQSSGKSTIMKMIQGIYQPTSGKIFLDQYDYDLLKPNTVRRNVVIVSDEAPLIGNTVFKAISYSRSEEKRDRAMQLLQRLNFHVAETEEENLDYHLDDFGKNLSAGQRKQVMFARALLTRKKILLLDEAFDDLDTESKKIIVDRINKQKTKRTIIVAGNNLPHELKVDRVIDLNEFRLQNQLVLS
ncbi:MAG TPA: ABC transporter ATP-binding protein [Chitinophagales bacterium]|nr:ABC transporter ATP-binding protein [Chitinophagales bacterium]